MHEQIDHADLLQVAAEIAKSGLDALTTRLETQGAKALESIEKQQGKQ